MPPPINPTSTSGAPIAFKLPRFYPIVDTVAWRHWQVEDWPVAETLLEAGARILQYRHKGEWTQKQFDEAERMAKLCHEAGVLFVVNDRADFAKLLKAALHVGQDDLPPVAARRVISDEVIGYSTHNREQLTRGDQEPVEYLSIGPIFATTSKENPDPEVGIEGLKALRPLTEKPLVAIGGITLQNATGVIEAGADSVAVIGGLMPETPTRKAFRTRVQDWMRLLA